MPASVSRVDRLDAFQLVLLDQLSSSLFDSLEVAHRWDVVLEFFVPRIATWAFVTMPDEQGEARIVARLDAHHSAEESEGETLVLPLRAAGEFLGSLHLRIRGRDALATQEFLQLAAARCAQALHNAILYAREQRVSLTFQNAALSAPLPEVPGYRFEAIYEAGRAEALVGGDWYDAFRLSDGRFVVSIGDVMGSGLKAAVAMVNVRQTMRGVAHIHADPVLMLQAADRALRDQYPERYVTTFVAIIDPVTQNCAYANAGHPPPFVRAPDGSVQPLRGHGTPLGLPEFGMHVEAHYTHLEPQSIVLLYTDGLTEASHDVVEGERHVRSALEQIDPRESGYARRIYERVLPAHSRDDVAILAVHVGAVGPVKRWRFDPRWHDVATRVRLEMSDELALNGFDPQRLFNFEVIFAELMANLVRYAPGTAEAFLEVRPDAFILHVTDKGPGFQFLPRLPHDLFSERGRGLFLISQLAGDFNVERRPGGGSHARVVLAP